MKRIIDYIARMVFLACALGIFGAIGAWETDHITFLRAMLQVLVCVGALFLMGAAQTYIQQK